MASNDQIVDPYSAPKPQPGRSPLHPLHEAALKLAALGMGRSKHKTRDLVAMLLSHGSRAWRNSQPQVKLHFHMTSPTGRYPVRMRLN